MRHKWKMCWVLLFALVCVACGGSSLAVNDVASAVDASAIEWVEKSIYVAPYTELCQNDSRECLLVRESLAEEWAAFDGGIIGFDYVAGYTYKLQLRSDSAESTEWELVDILSREGSFTSVEQESAASDLETWYLDYMMTNAIALDTNITLQFGSRNISGMGAATPTPPPILRAPPPTHSPSTQLVQRKNSAGN